MAQRYGGEFSPDTPGAGDGDGRKNRFRGQPVGRAPARVNLLFLAPIPLLFTAFGAGPVGMAVDLAAFATLILAAWLLRDGLKAEDIYNARSVARRPAIPRKLFASVLTGLGLALAGWSDGGSFIGPVIYGVIGTALHVFSFGMDPMKNKGMEGFDAQSNERVARAVDEAEKHLTAMREAVARLRDRALDARVEQFQATARDMFRTVEEDPRDLTAARRYLGVYLVGARDAAIKFADLYTKTQNPQDRADFEALLSDLETQFKARNRKLLLDDRTDLEVEMEVLRERLDREGVRPD